MNRRQRKISQILSSFLTIILTFALQILGVGWINALAISITIGLALLILTSSLSQRIQNFSSWIAYLLLAVSSILLIVFALPQIKENFQSPALLYGYVGGERYDLLVRNQQVQELLNKEDLQVTEGSITKKGSISQLSILQSDSDLDKLDFIWTGDAPIAEGGRDLIEATGKKILENEATLSDPLVLVVDKNSAKILSNSQFFSPLNAENSLTNLGFLYGVDSVTLADFLGGKSTWQQIGLTKYASPPGVIMSNARKSNGGVMAETLIGTIWYNMSIKGLEHQPLLKTSGTISQFQPLPSKIPGELAQQMEKLRLNSGFAESTSSKIQVQLEEGGTPWALTYYSVGQKIIRENDTFTLVALSHTLINSNQFFAFSENGTKLLRIIQSRDFEKIAQEYGYDAPKGEWIVLPDPSFASVKSLSNLLLENPYQN